MSAVIYKAGQGYWVRSLSAVFFGALVLAAAAWGWQQAGAVDLPVSAYTYRVGGVTGPVDPGAAVDLLAVDESGERLVARGVVESSERLSDSGAQVRVGSIAPEGGATVRSIDPDRLRIAGAFTARRDGPPVTHTVFPAVYLQAGVAGLVMLIGAVAIFWFVAISRNSVEFLIATDGEMKKVNWSTRREVIGSTWVVIVAAFLVAAVLFLIDTGFSSAFRAIGVLQGG